MYDDNYYAYDTELSIIVDDTRKTFNEVSADKKFLLTIVKNLVDEALKD